MTPLILYFVISALVGLVIINWCFAHDCDCELCQSPEAVATRIRAQIILTNMRWYHHAVFAFVWSLIAVPLVCLAIGIVMVELFSIE